MKVSRGANFIEVKRAHTCMDAGRKKSKEMQDFGTDMIVVRSSDRVLLSGEYEHEIS